MHTYHVSAKPSRSHEYLVHWWYTGGMHDRTVMYDRTDARDTIDRVLYTGNSTLVVKSKGV